jgi:hypothetical protein
MVGIDHDPVGESRKALPTAASGSISPRRILLAILLLLIAIAAITGVAMAITSGQPTVAFAISLVTAAFFCRVGC